MALGKILTAASCHQLYLLSFLSALSLFDSFFSTYSFFPAIRSSKKKTKPTLKNSTGASEKPGSLIQRLAPPASVTIEAGRACISIIAMMQKPKRLNPIQLSALSGFSLESHHMRKIPIQPTANWRMKK